MRIPSILHSDPEHTNLTFCRQYVFRPTRFDPPGGRAFLPVGLAALNGAAFFVIC
jgi:hypothetical protein